MTGCYRRSDRRSQGSLGFRWNQSPQNGEDLTRQKVAEMLVEGNSLNKGLKSKVQSGQKPQAASRARLGLG